VSSTNVEINNIFLITFLIYCRIYVNPCCVDRCHDDMEWPRVADEGYGLQIWSGDANLLNKQSQKDDKRWSSSWGFGQGASKS
jgi:hypothetical protein